jgi:hypothetical protein
MTATTRAGIASVIALLKAAFPSYNPEPDTAEVFYRLLSDMPTDLLEAAVIACITERGRAFAPSIGEIRGAAGELQKQAARFPTALEALAEVLAMPTDMRDPQLYEVQDEAGERFVELRQRWFSHVLVEVVALRMGWPRTFPGDNPAVDRAQFIRAYDAEAERILGLARAHPALEEWVARNTFEDTRPPELRLRARTEPDRRPPRIGVPDEDD